MSSVFYCTELSVSCWYCNANHGNLYQVTFEASEAHLYNFGEYEEDNDMKECEDTDAILENPRLRFSQSPLAQFILPDHSSINRAYDKLQNMPY